MQEKKLIFEKKGQTGGTVGTLILLIVGVGVSVMVLIFVGLLSASTFDQTEDNIAAIGSNTVTEEAFTILTDTGYETAHNDLQTSLLTIYNTTGDVIGNGNFTIDATNGVITLNSGIWNNTQGYVNYTWGSAEVRSSIQSGLVSSFEALEDTGSYMPILVLAVVIFLVLGLVMTVTMIGGNNTGGNTTL